MTYIGEFLLQKSHNMAAWLQSELQETSELLHLCDYFYKLTELEITAFAVYLLDEHKTEIVQRDWFALLSNMQKAKQVHALQIHLPVVLQQVRQRDDLHDKFWRYLALFSATIENSK